MCKLKSSGWCVSIAYIACSSPLPLLWELHYSACCPTFSCATFSTPPSLFHWLMSVASVAEYPWGKTTAISLHQIRSSWRLRRHWPVCVYILLLSVPLMPLPSMFGLLYPNCNRPIPAQKRILKQQVRVPLNIRKQNTKITCQCTNPSVTSSEPLAKRPENPSGATAVVVSRVHRGPRRDQLLDHGSVAFPSRLMQRRLASGAEDATRTAGRTAGRLRLPSRNKA